MTDLELYARARVAFITEPDARLYIRRDPLRQATTIRAERTIAGQTVRVAGLVGDETLLADDVRRVERLVRLVLARYRFTAAMLLAGQSTRHARDALATATAALDRDGVSVARTPPASWRLP